jgi:hypothetical protein
VASLVTLVANAPAKGGVKQRGEREMERGRQYACAHCGLAALIAKATAKGGVRKRGGGR